MIPAIDGSLKTEFRQCFLFILTVAVAIACRESRIAVVEHYGCVMELLACYNLVEVLDEVALGVIGSSDKECCITELCK